MNAIDQFRRWYEYEKSSHAKVLESLASVPDEARGDVQYQKAIDLLAHLAEARRLWLFRFGAIPEGPRDLFPRGLNVPEAADRLARIQQEWDSFFGELGEKDLFREFDYQSLEGEKYRNRVDDVLTQLFGHSLYHRGQIALLVRELGGRPAETDYIFWSRRLRQS